MEAIAINDNTWYFSGAVGRAFLFRGSQAALLVDTTNGPGNLREIITKLVGDIPVILVNTHADSDHIGCNHQFEKTLMHPSEFAYYACKCKPGDAIPNPIFDGEIIDIGGRVFEVILMPGHTYGSIVLLNRAERILVGGDTILKKVFIFGPQRNLRALICSLHRLKTRYGNDFDTIYTAHFDFPLNRNFLEKEIQAAQALLEGKLKAKNAGKIPLEPPDYKEASLYTLGEAGFFDYTELKY